MRTTEVSKIAEKHAKKLLKETKEPKEAMMVANHIVTWLHVEMTHKMVEATIMPLPKKPKKKK